MSQNDEESMYSAGKARSTGNNATTNLCLTVIVGASAAMGWNALANSLNTAQKVLFPEKVALGGIIVAVFNCSVLAGCFAMIYLGISSAMATIFGLVGSCIAAATFQIALVNLPTDAPHAVQVLAVLAVIIGLLASVALTGCMSLAASTTSPDESSTGASTGLGLSGMLSFTTWMIFSRIVWNVEEASQLRPALLAMAIMQVLLGAIAVASVLQLTNDMQAAKLMAEERSAIASSQPESYSAGPGSPREGARLRSPTKGGPQATEIGQSSDATDVCVRHDNDADQNKMPTTRSVLQAAGEPIFVLFAACAVSFILYPSMWPYRMPLAPADGDIVIGVFQAGDLIGRFAPAFFPRIPQRHATLVSCLRLLFLPWGVVLFLKTSLATLTCAILSTAALALSNGVLGTAGAVNAAAKCDSYEMKKSAATIGMTAMLGGVAFGSAISAVLSSASADQ